MTKTRSKSNEDKAADSEHVADSYRAADEAGRAAYEAELSARSKTGEPLPSRYGGKKAPTAKQKGAYRRRASRKKASETKVSEKL